MKVPFTSNQSNQSLNIKPSVNCSNTIHNDTFQGTTITTDLCYEPKSSATDLHQRPNPATKKPASKAEISTVCDDPIQLDDQLLNQIEDWDSLMKDLGLHEDNVPDSKPIAQLTQREFQTPYPDLPELAPTQSLDSPHFTHTEFRVDDFPQFPPLCHTNINPFDHCYDFHRMDYNYNVEYDYVDDLIGFAECFDKTNSVQLELAHVILARLNQRLRSPTGKPLQRAAYYFKEALQALLTEPTRLRRPSTSSEVIQTIKAHKTFSKVSPIPMFSSFMANQAVLEAVDGSILIHIIDFDIGFGSHWASFMEELADKAELRKTNRPYLRITALVNEEYAIESNLISENLSQFAREVNVGFDIEFVSSRSFEYLSFKSIKFMHGEKLAVVLSPSIFRRTGPGFVNDLQQVSPHVVVHVDSEGLIGFCTSSLRQTLIDGLNFYSTLLECLEAASASSGDGDWLSRIERFVLFPKILDLVEAAGGRGTPWREAFVEAGLRPMGLSQFADFQAECLLRRVQVRGFHVEKRQAEMLLFWHERALVATSAWRCY